LYKPKPRSGRIDIYKDHAFIGFSKLRKNSSTFAKLSFAEEANYAGIKIVLLPTAAEVGEILYKTSVDEIYEVVVLKDTTRPNFLNTMNPIHKFSLSIPGQMVDILPRELPSPTTEMSPGIMEVDISG